MSETIEYTAVPDLYLLSLGEELGKLTVNEEVYNSATWRVEQLLPGVMKRLGPMVDARRNSNENVNGGDCTPVEFDKQLSDIKATYTPEKIRRDEERYLKNVRLQEEEELIKPVLDHGSGKNITYKKAREKYGSKIAEEMYSSEWCSGNGKVAKETWKEIKHIHNTPKQNRNSKLPEISNKTQPTRTLAKIIAEDKNDHFALVYADLFDNAKESKCHHNPTILLIYLLGHRAFKDKKDRHNTWGNWYKNKNLITASVGRAKISNDLGVCRKTVSRYSKALEENGDIRVVKEDRENVYILGHVDKDGNEILYYRSSNRGQM